MSQSSKIIVLGAGGMLGVHIIRAFELYAPEFELISQTEERFVDSVDISAYLSRAMPATVINCMGHLAQDSELNFLVNSCLPRCVADCCEKYKSLCVHISTNAVFAPDEEYYWGTHDRLAPETPYEIAKAFGEDPRAYVIRTSFIGKHPIGRGIYDRLSRGEPFINRKWNGVTVWTLAKRIVEVVSENHLGPKAFTEHVHSPDAITFNELAKILKSTSICESYKRDARLLSGGINIPGIKSQLKKYTCEY